MVIGIDPGLQGAVAILDRGRRLEVSKVPLFKNKKGKNEYDLVKMAQLLRLAVMQSKGNLLVVLELVHAMPGQGVTSMFSMGRGVGLWEGLLAGIGITYRKVSPMTWQKAILVKTGDPKADSILHATKKFPKISFLPTPRCKKIDHNMTDATNLALYGEEFL